MEEEATAKAGQKRHAPESLSPVSVVTPKDDDIQAGGSAASNIEEDKAGCRSILKRSRITDQSIGRIMTSALDAVPTELVHRLRCKPQVAHHRDASAGHP